MDVVVVGGGPAGMVAARDLAGAGARTVLVDESAQLGGQYYKRRSGAVLAQAGDLRRRGTALAAQVHAAGVDVRSRTLVWGVADDGRTLLTDRAGEPGEVTARLVVLATGAHERVLPVPGWELPGVVTPGFALHLATIDRVAVGRRVLVAGSGPFLLPVAVALLDVGVEVAGVLEAGRPYRVDAGALGAVRHPARVLQFAGYRARLAAAGVPVRQGRRVLAVHGTDRVEAVTVTGPRGEHREQVDALALGWGFRPSTELAGLLGCATALDPVSGARLVRADDDGGTSRPDVLVAGEVAGIGGVGLATARGAQVAVTAARRLGLDVPAAGAARAARAVRAERRAADWTRARFAVDPPPRPAGNAVLCRCEAVTVAEVVGAGTADPDAVKGLTRAGMGPCQGRQCLPALAQLGLLDGRPAAFPARMPVRPVPLGVLAAAGRALPRLEPPHGPADSAVPGSGAGPTPVAGRTGR
ncbi:NAD(P)/FAD-dependent oxidoreductase [Modestobacter versicolor]|uniref:FAD/NAD(P)-dependent oxidoreductase n=1 Tax=Modestobacter versicolor TaxID=429133 RepID=UPI0034DE825B